MRRPSGRLESSSHQWQAVELADEPLTATARGVALWLGATLAVVALLTSVGAMEPAFVNEPEVVAVGFLLGAFVAAAAIWRREPARMALTWVLLNVALAAGTLAFPVALGLALAPS